MLLELQFLGSITTALGGCLRLLRPVAIGEDGIAPYTEVFRDEDVVDAALCLQLRIEIIEGAIRG